MLAMALAVSLGLFVGTTNFISGWTDEDDSVVAAIGDLSKGCLCRCNSIERRLSIVLCFMKDWK